MYLHALARALGPEQPCYAARALGLEPDEPVLERVEDMAEAYVRAIREVQPRGPYLLAGHSFGADVAWTVAQRLRADGDELAQFISFDSPAPRHRDGRPRADLSVGQWVATAAAVLAQEFPTLDVSGVAWDRLSEAEQLRVLTQRLVAAGVLPERTPSAADSVDNRFDRRKVMLASDAAAGVCTFALMLLFASGHLDLWHIYLANACNAMARSCQWPAYAASVPQLVPGEHLGRANGLLQLSGGLSQLVAPLLGGIMIVALPIASIFVVDLATFAIAVVTLGAVRFPTRPSSAEAAPERGGGSLEAWRTIRHHRGLLALTLLVVLGNFTAGSVEVLVTPLVLSFADPTELGVLLTIGGLGMVGGSLGLSAWGGGRRLVLLMLISECVAGCAMILAGLRPDFVILALAAVLFFAALPVGNGCHHSLLQRELDPRLQGRAFALLNAAASAALILGYLGSGPLADHVFEPLMAEGGALASTLGAVIGHGRGIGLLFILMGVASLLASVVTALRPGVRRLDAPARATVAQASTPDRNP